MNIFLIRHTKAGHRLSGYQDRYRPLSDEGKTQASNIDRFFLDKDVSEILSSPAVRCQQTVEPLGARLSLPVVESDILWEDSLPSEILELINASSTTSTVLCSHGNLIPVVISMLRDSGVTTTGRGGSKGSIWWIQGEPNAWTTATYHSPDSLAAG